MAHPTPPSDVDGRRMVAEHRQWQERAMALEALADEVHTHLDEVVTAWDPAAFRGGPARRAHAALQEHRGRLALAADELREDAALARTRAAALGAELEALGAPPLPRSR